MPSLKRFYSPLENYLSPGKVLVIYGPRRSGKTTLIQQFLNQTSLRTQIDTGENIRVKALFVSQNPDLILEYLTDIDIYVIDGAQDIDNIGKGLKLIADSRPDLIVIATGSSSQIGLEKTFVIRRLTGFLVMERLKHCHYEASSSL